LTLEKGAETPISVSEADTIDDRKTFILPVVFLERFVAQSHLDVCREVRVTGEPKYNQGPLYKGADFGFQGNFNFYDIYSSAVNSFKAKVNTVKHL
jgi:hypothetical protein